MSNSVFETIDATKRKAWLPITPTADEIVIDGAVDTISKCFALRILELPVKSFILDGLSRPEASKIGEDGVACLIRNSEDEDKHDIALTNCLKVFKNYNPAFEQEAQNILNAWASLEDNPITITACLENGLFFVILPLYRKFGGPSARTTALDISADEVNHVMAHRTASEMMGFKPSRKLDNLRKATCDWLVKDLTADDPDVYRRSSDNLMYKGVAPELAFTKSYTVPAFFEHRSDNLPYYTTAS
jgi:hypothetical protein